MSQRSHSHEDFDGITVSTVGPEINRKHTVAEMTEKPPLPNSGSLCANDIKGHYTYSILFLNFLSISRIHIITVK